MSEHKKISYEEANNKEGFKSLHYSVNGVKLNVQIAYKNKEEYDAADLFIDKVSKELNCFILQVEK